MRRTKRCLLTLVAIGILALAGLSARADTTDSPLLNGLSTILRDPDTQLAFTPDRKAVVLMSNKGEVSFGADCTMRLHAPGTLERMVKLTEGISVDLGAALGHREQKDPDAVACLVKLAKDHGFNWRLRPNEVGFRGKSYTPQERPLDMWGSIGKLTVAPNGACTFQKTERGPLGFAPAKVRPIDQGSGGIVPAVGHSLPARPASLGYAPTSRSRFKPAARGAYLRTRRP